MDVPAARALAISCSAKRPIIAKSWEPSSGVVLEPTVQFGAPCIKGTRIPTRTVAGMIEAGDSPEYVAQTYGQPMEAIEEACEWERRLRAA